jgi:hypothetical protein
VDISVTRNLNGPIFTPGYTTNVKETHPIGGDLPVNVQATDKDKNVSRNNLPKLM